jgi:hypothetical protein
MKKTEKVCKRVMDAHGATFSITIPIKLEPKIERGENIWIKKLESSSLMMTRT